MVLSDKELLDKIREIKEAAGFQLGKDKLFNFLAQTPYTIFDMEVTVEKIKKEDPRKKRLKRFIKAIQKVDYETVKTYMIKEKQLTVEDIKESYARWRIKTTENGAELVKDD